MSILEQTRGQARALAGQALAAARQTGRRTADGLEQTSRPIHRLADAGMRLNRISAEYFNRMLRQQAESFDHLLHDGANRLRLASDAQSLRGLWREQLSLLPASRDRLVGDVRATFGILRDTGRQLGTLLRDGLGQTVEPAAESDAPQPTAARRTRKAPAPAVETPDNSNP